MTNSTSAYAGLITLLWKNYFNKQRASTLAQIDYLYKEKDVTFRGFRHSAGQLGGTGDKQKDKTNRGNEVLDGMTNWENTSVDGERFSQQISNSKGNKSLRSFDEYIVRKEARAATKKIERERLAKVKKATLVKSEVSGQLH